MSVIQVTPLYKTHAWSHHEYDFANGQKTPKDKTYLINDVDLSKLPKNWDVVEKFKNSLDKEILYNCMVEISVDLSRFGLFFSCKNSTVEQLSDIIGVDLKEKYDLYLDGSSVYLGFWFDGKTGVLQYIRKAVKVIKENEIGCSEKKFKEELKSVCDKFGISDIPSIHYKPNMADTPFYTFELRESGGFHKLQFEIFTKNQYQLLNNYWTDEVSSFVCSLELKQLYPYITHYKIDYIENKWQLIKVYFCGLDNDFEFLKKAPYTEYKNLRFINENEVIESLSSKLKRLIG